MKARLSKGWTGWSAAAFAAAVTALAVGMQAASAAAQYTSPGDVATSAQIPSKENMEGNVDDSRWRLGVVRVSPWIGLRDAALVSSQDSAQMTREDFTATAGAGLRAYLPTGKVVWAAHLLPEYTWWQDDPTKRRLNGRYGLGFFGYFNHLTVEVSQRRTEQQSYFSDELRELTTSRSDDSTLRLEVQPVRRLLFYGAARRTEISNQETEDATLALLDREVENYSLGVRYRSPGGWLVGLGLEDTTTDFGPMARNLSNSGTSQQLETGFDGNRFDFHLSVGFRDLKGEPGSDFGRFDQTTGGLEVLWDASPQLSALGYGRRQQRFSIDSRNSYVLNQRQGVRIDYGFANTSLGVRFEVGEDEYAEVETGRFGRVDDVTAFGVDLWFDVNDVFGLAAQFLQTEYDSNVAGFDRDITSISLTVELGSVVQKLSLGRPDAEW